MRSMINQTSSAHLKAKPSIRFIRAILKWKSEIRYWLSCGEERKKVAIAYAWHCFMIGHHIEGFRKVEPFDVLPNFTNQRFDSTTNFAPTNPPKVGIGGCRWLNDISPGNESHFEIDLSEFRLSVLSAVFIAETFGDLKIFIDNAGAD